MNRKDIIIISVLVNTALLAVLFITATQSEDAAAPREEVIRTAISEPQPVVDQPVFSPQLEIEPYLAEAQPPLDEVDHVLRDYVPEEGLPLETPQEQQVMPDAPPPEAPKPVVKSAGPENYVEVTVKKGDMLEKIARANGTTVLAIKDANKLTNDKLKIGQVLKIPADGTSTSKPTVAQKPAPAVSAVPATPAAPGDPVYYTVKSGDNPWKIAKQFGVRFEDILKLNNMTEEQSRKLQVGDKIRVK